MDSGKVHDCKGEAWSSAGRRLGLRSGRPPLPNSLSKRQMDSLAAVCDTFLPKADAPNAEDEDLADFYRTSASTANVPEIMGGILSGGVQHPATGLLRVALWMLSTWYGTLVLCGWLSLSNRFPYVRKFSEVEQDKRERIILSWSGSWFRLLRMLFKCMKFLTMRVYFAQVDEKGENPSWKAMGYCGPDPELINLQTKSPQRTPPLRSALLHMDSPIEAILSKLRRAGFSAASSSPLTLCCDAVVVGSGSGGSVVASVLARAGHKVLVLEKGHYYQTSDLSLLEGPTNSEMYESGGLLATEDIGVVILAGSTVGGGSTINWSASLRTPDHVTKEWRDELGLELFGSEAYCQALDVVCERLGVQDTDREEGFNNAVLRRGCQELEIPVSNVPCNAPQDHYCGWCHLGCKDAKKKSAQETWLVDVANSSNGLIIPGCQVLKVLTKKNNGGSRRKKAAGVLVQFQNETFVVEAKVTVVASGALNTPRLLKNSGLRNRHIGQHLHLHPCVMAWGYFPPEKWPERTKKSYEGGILTSMAVAVPENYGVILQTPALHPAMFAALTPWVSAADFRERMRRFNRTAHIFALTRDKGFGTSNYPDSVKYQINGGDEEKMKKGLETALRVLAAAGAEEVGTQHAEGERLRLKEAGTSAVEEYVETVRRRELRDLMTPVSSAHQMGSCRMGVGPEAGAVSSGGEAWEVEGLFVADASVLPTALGVNPMVTVMAVAYCTAQSVLEVLRRKKVE